MAVPGEPAVRVTLSGDRRGDYLVVEERPDGSLLIAPTSVVPRDRQSTQRPSLWRRGGQRGGEDSQTVPELLAEWDIELAADEFVVMFLAAELDRRAGFLVLTRDRFIFVSQTYRGPEVVLMCPRSSVRDTTLIGRRLSSKLTIVHQDGEAVVGAADPAALKQLQDHLIDR